jgi:hypothetical protein
VPPDPAASSATPAAPESLPPLPESPENQPTASASVPDNATGNALVPPTERTEAVPVPAPVPVPTERTTPQPSTVPPQAAADSSVPRIATAPARDELNSAPSAPTSLPALPSALDGPAAGSRPRTADSFLPDRLDPGKTLLTPEQMRRIERLAEKQDEDMRRDGVPGRNLPPETSPPGGLGGVPSTRLEISRAPSPTEARPIRAIPVPDEFVPLAKRDWSPSRKYWSAAAACHMPLYFQDAALERYGHSTESFFGPVGRYLSYPVDDPKQSTQRNQIAQPFMSAGLFALQILALPYNMIMDPPWEAEYDLGYYRPGDRVPTDVYYLPIFGVGPPGRGSNY